MGHYLKSQKTGRFHFNPTIKRSTLLRDYQRTKPLRPKIAGVRRRTWEKKKKPVVPGPLRVTVGTGVSVEGQSYSLTYTEWVAREDVEDAKARGRAWIRDVIVNRTGNPRYRTDSSWSRLDWGETGGFNIGVDDTPGVVGRVLREGTRQSFVRRGGRWVKRGGPVQMRFGDDV
jgi:hypothetical protein